MSEDTTSGLASYLKDHPRMMGVLFTLTLLLSQAGTAVAGNAGATSGP
ncbi:MAG: hypothetical protein ABEH78_10540 [Haloferacaceae archaeon]